MPSYLDQYTENQLKDLGTKDLLSLALFPSLSPEEQYGYARAMQAGQVGQEDPIPVPAAYLNPPSFIPQKITAAERRQYLSADRATQALSSLENIRTIMDKDIADMGPGYNYLIEIVNELKRFGGTAAAPMNRQAYVQFSASIDNIMNRMKSDVESNAPDAEDTASAMGLAKSFSSPFFSAGPLMNVSQGKRGGYKFGAPNARLFG